MLHIGNERVPLCSGPCAAASCKRVRRAGRPDAAGTVRLQSAGAVDETQAKIKNCITIFLVGSPGHLDTWDMKPDAPAEVRGKFKPITTNVTGHPDLRALPADGPDDGQGGADPQPAPQDRRDARERPALDDDRPRLQRRQREAAHRQRHLAASSARRATCRPTSSCPGRSATPAPARCTARPPATSAARTSRSS